MYCEKHLKQKSALSCPRLSKNLGCRLAQREFLHLVSFPSHASRAMRRYLSHQPGGAPAQESATVKVTKVVLMLHIRLPAWGLTQISKYKGVARSSTLWIGPYPMARCSRSGLSRCGRPIVSARRVGALWAALRPCKARDAGSEIVSVATAVVLTKSQFLTKVAALLASETRDRKRTLAFHALMGRRRVRLLALFH